MALFNQSTKTYVQVIQEVADAVGLSADTEATTRAFRSLNAGIEYLNGRANWDWMLTEADPVTLVAPFSVTGVSASAGVASALVPASHGILVDDLIGFSGLNAGTRVSATAAGSIGFNSTITSAVGVGEQVVTAGITRDLYPLPSAWKAPYSVRLYGAQSTLRLIRRRFYDRSITDEFSTSTPVGYDIFLIGGKGKLRMLPPPTGADVMQLRYYRRITVASASGDTGTLDLPQDAEPYLVAWAKWHFIVDKGEGRKEQAQTWIAFANEGIRTLLADQARIPDEDLMFTPGHYTYNPAFNPNATRGVDWVY